MIRAIFLYLSAATLFAAASDRPNVLLILADDLGFSDLSCYGSEIQTPNIDRLATGGTKFSAFYNSARCCPSRAALVTGLEPHEAGIGSFTTESPQMGWGPAYTGHLLPDAATLPEILAHAGYSTWMVGKWHLGSPGPIARGFRNYYGFRDMLAHSEGQWNPAKYVRLPDTREPELEIAHDAFYATDAFNRYALEFLRQAREKKGYPVVYVPFPLRPPFPHPGTQEGHRRQHGNLPQGLGRPPHRTL